MSDPVAFPSPPPAPARRSPVALLAVAVAVLAVVVAAGVLADGDPAGAPSDGRNSATETTAAQDPLLEWVAEHGLQSASIMREIEDYAADAADDANAGDLLGLLSTCTDGEEYLRSVAIEPVSLDSNAPEVWTRAITLWQAGFAACADGEIESATELIGRGTEAISELTALLREVQP